MNKPLLMGGGFFLCCSFKSGVFFQPMYGSMKKQNTLKKDGDVL